MLLPQTWLISVTALLSFQAVLSSPLGVTVGLDPHYHPIQSLYHAQDNVGQYVYGYATPTSTKSETKTSDGITRGGYSYIDSNGYLQSVQYTADAIHGFRVAATNLPQELPDVAHARAQHMADFEAIRNEHAHLAAVRAVPYSNPIAVPLASVPVIPTHQQLPQQVTDLPEVIRARNEHLAILNAAYANAGAQVAPQPVQDLPEVARARTEHLAAVEQTRIRDAALRQEIALSPVPEQISEGVIPLKTVTSSYVNPTLPVAQINQISYTPAIAAAVVPSQQHTAHNDLGQYSYGYLGPLSSHSETRTPDGVTRGGYSYIDAHGIVQTVHYVADAEHGFRVAATNIPVDVNHVAAARSAVVSAEARPLPAVPVETGKVVVKAVVPGELLYNHEIVY